MKRGLSFLAYAVSLGACGGSDDAVTDTAASSESGGDTSTSGSPTSSPTTTEPATTASESSGDTTCSDGCTSSAGDSGTGSSGNADSSTDTTGAESSSEGTPEESSSEGPSGVCGNGVVEGGEDCDDSGVSATCDGDCTDATCGDALLNTMAGEICDAGGESFGCDVDCTLPVCGDGIANASANEICDDGGPTATCDPDCTAPSCGDGSQNIAVLETCDDGNNDSNDGCSASCLIEGDFGGACVVVDGTQWCFDDDNCGQSCADVCGALDLVLEPDDATWFAAQDSAAECQAIADGLGMDAPIQFGASALGCLEDSGLDDQVGGGLTGGLICSSDASCPAAHRDDMDDLGGICNLPGARRSVCPCVGQFCGNAVVEGDEECDDGNQVGGDGCTATCTTGPDVCSGGVDPGTGSPYVICSVDDTGAWVSIVDAGGGTFHPDLVCQELGYTTVGEWGGNCGSVCGYCEMSPSTCEANGTAQFDFGAWTGVGNCGSDMLGELICTTVMWTCI
jgi:cysteine-rich repeat protein